MTYIVLDIETSKKPHHKPWKRDSFLSSICIGYPDGKTNVWFFNPSTRPHEEMLKEIQIEIDKVSVIIGHNIKFDATWLLWVGIKLEDKLLFCTMQAEYLLNGQYGSGKENGELSLNELGVKYKLGTKLDAMKAYWDAGFETDQIPLAIHDEYIRQDVNLTHEIFKVQAVALDKYGLSKLAELAFQVGLILAEMEVNGVAFDKKFALEFHASVDNQITDIDAALTAVAGVKFSPASNAHLRAVMFGGSIIEDGVEEYTVTLKSGVVKNKTRKCKIPRPVIGLSFSQDNLDKSDKTQAIKLDKDALSKIRATTKEQKEFLSLLVKRRGIAKAVSTLMGSKEDTGLINKVGSDGRLHPAFNQCVTVTGRLSSSDPNGQNLPRKSTTPVKVAITPTNKYMVNVDFGKIEWCMAAELCRDPVMINEINTGVDIHSINACNFFGADKHDKDSAEFSVLRTAAKTVTFRLLYGGSAYAFFKDQRMPQYPLARWEEIVASFYNKYKQLQHWQNTNFDTVNKHGYLRNPTGRILTYAKSKLQKDGTLAYSKPTVCNYSVQSISADVMFLAMREVRKFITKHKCKSKMVLVVHDSLVLDVPEEELTLICKEVSRIFADTPVYMKQTFGYEMIVPIVGDCECGPNYGTLTKYKATEIA